MPKPLKVKAKMKTMAKNTKCSLVHVCGYYCHLSEEKKSVFFFKEM